MLSRRTTGLTTAALLLTACAGRRQVDPNAPAPAGGAAAGTRAPTSAGPAGLFGDATAIYQRMGLIAPAAPVPFVGTVRYMATARPDTTLALVAVSLQNRALTFARDNDRFRASYEVRAELRQNNQTVRRIEQQQLVRVNSFRETTRGDESVIFQQTLPLAPGEYTMSLAVRDSGSARSSVQEVTLVVPRLGPSGLSSPITVYEGTPRTSADAPPQLVVTPRATFTFGRDSAALLYLEGYGGGTSLPVRVSAFGDRGTALWSGTAALARRGDLFSGLISVPLAPLGVGRVVTLVAERGDTRDSSRAPLFVTFGDELPVTTFDEMMSYLRYFAAPYRIAALRNAPVERRAALWGDFLRATDPAPATPQNEALRDYFLRIAQANVRFRDDAGGGWLSDRGMVYVTLGDPDQIYQQGGVDVNARGRAQIWEYRDDRVQLVFIDQSGFGRWRLTNASESDFRALARRREQSNDGK